MNKTLSLLLLLFSNAIYAGTDQVPIDRKITGIATYASFVIIHFLPEFENTQNCDITKKSSIVLDFKDNSSHKEMYSSVLAAASASKEVGFGLGGCSAESSQYPSVYRVDVGF